MLKHYLYTFLILCVEKIMTFRVSRVKARVIRRVKVAILRFGTVVDKGTWVIFQLSTICYSKICEDA